MDRTYGGTMDDEQARPRTAAATEARRQMTDQRYIEQLRSRGYVVFKPVGAHGLDGDVLSEVKRLIGLGMPEDAAHVAYFAGYLSGSKMASRVHEYNEQWKAPTLPVELPGASGALADAMYEGYRQRQGKKCTCGTEIGSTVMADPARDCPVHGERKAPLGSPGTYRWYMGARVALVCQVSNAGTFSVEHLPCEHRDGNGYQCERIDTHSDRHMIGTHTIEHTKMGNGYACHAIGWFKTATFLEAGADPFASPGDGTDAGHRPGCSCLSVDIPCKP